MIIKKIKNMFLLALITASLGLSVNLHAAPNITGDIYMAETDLHHEIFDTSLPGVQIIAETVNQTLTANPAIVDPATVGTNPDSLTFIFSSPSLDPSVLFDRSLTIDFTDTVADSSVTLQVVFDVSLFGFASDGSSILDILITGLDWVDAPINSHLELFPLSSAGSFSSSSIDTFTINIDPLFYGSLTTITLDYNIGFVPNAVPIPEPATYMLLGSCLILVAYAKRKRLAIEK